MQWFVVSLEVLYLVLPAIVTAGYLSLGNTVKSRILRTILPWLLGHILFTTGVALVASILSLMTTKVLLKATLLCLLAIIPLSGRGLRRLRVPTFSLWLLTALFAGISTLIFTPHLVVTPMSIDTSPLYWDFTCHFATIQGFSLGDNFPPQMESFAGVFQTYHFMSNVPMGILAALGEHPGTAINIYSIFIFTLLLLGVVGVVEELFGSLVAGVLAVCMTLTASSLRWITMAREADWSEPLMVLRGILYNNAHPYLFAFEDPGVRGYDGNMYNLFYFVEERQLIVPTLVFILAPVVYKVVTQASTRIVLATGALLGLFFIWHAYVTIALLVSLVVMWFFSSHRKHIFSLLVTAGVVILPQFLFMHWVASSDEFLQAARNVPRINFRFSALPRANYEFSVPNAIRNYVYTFGPKIVTSIVGLYLLTKRSRRWAVATGVLVAVTFILTNTVRISPTTIYDNHKWIRPMTVMLDILSAGFLWALIRRSWFLAITVVPLVIASLTLSGIIEGIPYLRSKPDGAFTLYPSHMHAMILKNSSPKEVFATRQGQQVSFAGRRVYVYTPDTTWGNVFVYEHVLNKGLRRRRQERLFTSTNIRAWCRRARRMDVHVVELPTNPLRWKITHKYPEATVSTSAQYFGQITFARVDQVCGPPAE